MGWLALLLFFIIFILLLRGYPVAFTLGGVSIVYALIIALVAPEHFNLNIFYLLPSRIMGTLNNYVLMAVPLFIFMGIMLEKSGLAEELLETMALLFGRIRGGLAVSVVIVGALLAASTGIVGATVVTMGLISLPVMLKQGYKPELATGAIVSSGTLGQIIPPSVVLVLLADVMSSSSRSGQSVDVGAMFKAALLPGALLVLIYIVYILVVSNFSKDMAPKVEFKEQESWREQAFWWRILRAFVIPILLIVMVLGSIFMGIASPTEAAAIGAMGATLLMVFQKKNVFSLFRDVMRETTFLTTMVFFILLGATTFSLVFRALEGDDYLISLITEANLSETSFLLLVMLTIFIAGFFIDFIEIIFILVPIITPILDVYEVNLLWVGVLIALNLQTSFLTPPFGFALFYLKGVAPPGVDTKSIYMGAIPFIIIQLLFLITIFVYPEIIGLSR